jgi:hypothetical protein
MINGGDDCKSSFPLSNTTAHKDMLAKVAWLPPTDVSVQLKTLVVELRAVVLELRGSEKAVENFIESNKGTICGAVRRHLLGRDVYDTYRCTLHLDHTNGSRMWSKKCKLWHAYLTQHNQLDRLGEWGDAFTKKGFKGAACDTKTGWCWIIVNNDGSRKLRDQHIEYWVDADAGSSWGGPDYEHAYLLACMGMLAYAHAQPVKLLRMNDPTAFARLARPYFARWAQGRRVVVDAFCKSTTPYDTSMASLVVAHVVDAIEMGTTINAMADGSGLEMLHPLAKKRLKLFGGGLPGASSDHTTHDRDTKWLVWALRLTSNDGAEAAALL